MLKIQNILIITMKFKKQKVRYWFDTFKHLKPFDIIPYQEVIDMYLANHNLLGNN